MTGFLLTASHLSVIMSADQMNRQLTPFRRRRLSLGLDQSDIATFVGATISAVSAWEAGKRLPSASFIPKLAKALKLSPAEVMELLAPSEPATAPA